MISEASANNYIILAKANQSLGELMVYHVDWGGGL